jgi:type I restriction enzyme S subunit
MKNGGRYKPYLRYKDSGVEWIGKIPEAWDVRRLKLLSECLDGQRVPLNSTERAVRRGDYPYWGANGIVDYLDGWLFDEKLVLLGEDGAPFFEPHKTVAFFVQGKIWVNNHAHVLRPDKVVSPGFLAYALNCVEYRAFIDGSTRDKLTQDDMRNIPIQFPSLPEQRAIAEFLGRETAKIDELITKKERLVELLEEKRAALITHAVTRGLNPDAPLRDSGIEWLGEIPAHWELKQLGHEVKLLTGFPFKSELFSFSDGTKLVRGDNVTSGALRWGGKTRYWSSVTKDIEVFLLKADDVLLGMDGSKVGKNYAFVADSDLPLLLVQRVARLRAKSGVQPGYLYHLFSSRLFPAWVDMVKTDPAVPHISPHDIRSFPVVFPPMREQEQIVAFLNTEAARFSRLRANILRAVETLKEYRSALITSAVTGKIDVRAPV